MNWRTTAGLTKFRKAPPGYKHKDLTLIPFQVATALRERGWYLRNVIIWAKASAVEPTRLDRIATAHEYVFLFSQSEHYAAHDPGEPWWNRSVWTISHDQDGEHVAMMPVELARRCIVCSRSRGDLILDPFCGSGTTGRAALRVDRQFVGIEINPENVAMSERRITGDAPLFNTPGLLV